MSRYALTPDQLSLLDKSELDDLRLSICNEQAELGKLEYLIYRRRREIDIQEHPELVTSQPMHVRAKSTLRPAKQYASSKTISAILSAAQHQGIDLASLLNNSINE